MAQKRPRRRPARGTSDDESGAGQGNAAGREWPPEPAPVRREIRPFIYAGFDFAMAVVYALLITQAPTRHAGGSALLWTTVVAVVLAGAGMLWRNRWGWRAAVVGCGLLLAATILILVLILLSASFLAGVYGAMGRGAAMMALLAGAIVIEFCGLLPAFQLKFLLTRAGRRHYGVPVAQPIVEPAG
jgi:hypothetical protein